MSPAPHTEVVYSGKYIASSGTSIVNEDFIARVQDGPSGCEVNYIMSTEVLNEKIAIAQDLEGILKRTIRNLWETHKYNQEYISFLLGSYSEEEFLKIADEFAEEPLRDLNEEQISFSLNLLSSLLDCELSSSDLSIALNQDCSHIESALKKSNHLILY